MRSTPSVPMPSPVAESGTDSADIRCSFCGAARHEVDTMVASDPSPHADACLHICGPCIQLCVQIMYGDGSDGGFVTITAPEYAALQEASRQLHELREHARLLAGPMKGLLAYLDRTADCIPKATPDSEQD